MITVYTLDKNNIWTGNMIQQSEKESLKGVIEAPPTLSGTEVAQRKGSKWVILPSRPDFLDTITNKNNIINELVSKEFNKFINNGYITSQGFIMQCNRSDYEMMEQGLQVFLDTPTADGGAGGDTSVITNIVDKYNISHQLSIADAQTLTTEMKQYFWSLWNRKTKYRIALQACANTADMDKVKF